MYHEILTCDIRNTWYIYSMLKRKNLLILTQTALKRSPIVALMGPRQTGKTTLARQFVAVNSENYFDLEDPASLGRLDHPKTALEPLTGLVVIDEIQRKPELFPILRVLADRRPVKTRFLILGSASPDLRHHSSETLAGRMETIPVGGFALNEVGEKNINRHWLRGAFPISYLAKTDADSTVWRKNFIQTILERDLPLLGVKFPSPMLFRLWGMLAHYHGQTWNGAEISKSLGISEPTVKRYVEFLEGLYLIRQLAPWHSNLGKRLVKSPKLYIRDSGILHFFLGIGKRRELLLHPKLGASWEGYSIEEILKTTSYEDAFFWGTHNRAEMDLILLRKGKLIGIECKHSDAPRITPSIQNAMDDLKLHHVWIIHPNKTPFNLAKNVTAVSMQHLLKELA